MGEIHYDGSKVKKTGKHKEVTYGTLRLVRQGSVTMANGLFNGDLGSSALIPMFQFTDGASAMNRVQQSDNSDVVPNGVINCQLSDLRRCVLFGNNGDVLAKVALSLGTSASS